MLWLPTKQSRKALAQIKRLRRRRRLARVLLFLFIIFGLTTASAPSGHALRARIDRATTGHKFDFVDWESFALASELQRRLASPPLPSGATERQALVETFLKQEEQIRNLDRELNRLYAVIAAPGPESKALEAELRAIQAAQAEITPLVEMILAEQVEIILREEGFTLANHVFPPVAFRFIDPPTALIISPRDRIQNQHFVGLQPGLENKQRFTIEEALEQRGDVAGYVTDIGGLGSYPTMVISHPTLVYLTEIIAHEWVHNYLFTFPTNIAWGFQSYPRLLTINETTAELVGQEISRRVITRFYPDWIDNLPPLDDTGQPAPPEPSEFHLAMRRIRQEVDRLLAAGKIEEAETYMETERQKLVKKGYNLRKLNQAYFAFHGSYALSPASVDPTGSQIRQLRAASPSLKDFLNRVGWLNSYKDYQNWLSENKIE